MRGTVIKAPDWPAKASLGPIRGSAIRLGDWRGGDSLVIAEGIENALSVAQSTGLPAWAVGGRWNLPALDLPACIRNIIIASDPDEPGMKAADIAAARWSAEGRTVRVAVPPEAGVDFNEILMRGYSHVG